MSGQGNAQRRIPRPRLAPATDERLRTPMGLGVPVAPSFLELEDEETVAYNARRTPAVSLPSLLAECEPEAEPAVDRTRELAAPPAPPSRPRGSFHTVPVFPEDLIDEPVAGSSVESNLHQIEADTIKNSLRPSAHQIEPDPIPLSPAPRAPRGEAHPVRSEVHQVQREVRHLRIGVSSFPPESLRPEQVRPPPSPRRSFVARLLFFTIVVTVLLLIATEVSVASHLPWLDPRPHLLKGFKFLAERVPWDRIPKLPHL